MGSQLFYVWAFSFGIHLQRSLAFLQNGKFERSGFQKYEQPSFAKATDGKPQGLLSVDFFAKAKRGAKRLWRMPRRNLRKQMKPGNIAMISLNGHWGYSRLGTAKCEARRRQPGNAAQIFSKCLLLRFCSFIYKTSWHSLLYMETQNMFTAE